VLWGLLGSFVFLLSKTGVDDVLGWVCLGFFFLVFSPGWGVHPSVESFDGVFCGGCCSFCC